MAHNFFFVSGNFEYEWWQGLKVICYVHVPQAMYACYLLVLGVPLWKAHAPTFIATSPHPQQLVMLQMDLDYGWRFNPWYSKNRWCPKNMMQLALLVYFDYSYTLTIQQNEKKKNQLDLISQSHRNVVPGT